MKRSLTIRDDINVSPRVLESPKSGKAAGKSIKPYLKDLIQDYYEFIGWDRQTGKPLQDTLKMLHLEDEGKGL